VVGDPGEPFGLPPQTALQIAVAGTLAGVQQNRIAGELVPPPWPDIGTTGHLRISRGPGERQGTGLGGVGALSDIFIPNERWYLPT
jgi:hypothetical protein